MRRDFPGPLFAKRLLLERNSRSLAESRFGMTALFWGDRCEPESPLARLAGLSLLSVAEQRREKCDHKRRPRGIDGQVGDLPALEGGK